MHILPMSKVDLLKHFLAIVLLASVAPYQVAHAQQPLHLPSSELAAPGAAQKSPISAPTIDASAYANLSTAEALATQFTDVIPHTRSPQDVALFAVLWPSTETSQPMQKKTRASTLSRPPCWRLLLLVERAVGNAPTASCRHEPGHSERAPRAVSG